METTKKILFICPHGAAKSVIAAADCRQQAAHRGLRIDATSAGTEPDAAVPLPVVAALRAEGIDVSAYRPERSSSGGTIFHRSARRSIAPAPPSGPTSSHYSTAWNVHGTHPAHDRRSGHSRKR